MVAAIDLRMMFPRDFDRRRAMPEHAREDAVSGRWQMVA